MYGYLKCVFAKGRTEAQAVVSRSRVVPLTTIALLLACAAGVSADPVIVGQNLAKYWSYRSNQRTKFIRVGTTQGCSMPACWRCVPEAQMNWGDSTLDTGWYIGALATEHYMLSNSGLFPGYSTGGGDINVCRDELQKALAALNRVDATAENAIQAGFPDQPGFFIRDDVPDDFFQFFPQMTNILSDYTNPDWWAKEMSQDQVCHILLGLTLVKQLIPAGLVVNGLDLRASAIMRGSQIVDWTHQHGWLIYDPVTNAQVNRGPDARVFAKGFNGACVFLTDGAVNFDSSISGFYASLWNSLNSPSNPAYDNYNNRHMAMVLAAEANGWGNGTLNSLMSLADAYDWYAYPMLYAILYPSVAQAQGTWAGHRATMNSVVQGQINLAPVSGPHEPTSPAEEGTGRCADRKFIRTLDNANQGGATDGYEYPGLDYLVLHNLFYIMTPSNWENPNPGQSPYAGVIPIPGTVQAENFDNGGEGVAYHDNDTSNNGGQYRTTGVDIEATSDTGGGYNVGWTGAGEWLEYTVNVNTTGDYAIKMRVASGSSGGTFSLSIDGGNIATGKSFTGTGGWQNWTTVIVPGILLSSGTNKILRLTVDAGDPNVNSIDFTFSGADVVSEDLASTNVDDGMTHPQVGDGNTVAASIGGHNCRKNNNPSIDFYTYFTVSDVYALNGNKSAATITFDYYDTGTISLNLQYDGSPGAYTQGPSVALTNSNTWKTAVWQVSDAYFGNRQNSGSDFRIAAPVGATFYLDTVTVFATVGTPPGQASNPNPANGATLVNRNADLSWTAGSGATNRDVRFGTANPPPFVINQTATTYDPGTMAANTTYFWRIDEKNGAGTTTGAVWSFTTLPLPGVASAPNPANAATGVSTTPTLTWTAGSNASSHDVRFGTANPPPFIQNQAGTSYAPSTLSNSTTYFWRIDEVNSSGTTTGTVWSFTTAASAPPYFTNSSFENGFSAAGGGYVGNVGTGWTPYIYNGVAGNFTFADETGAGNFDTGSHSQKITAVAGKEGGVYNRFAVTSGQNYTVTVRVKSASPAAWCFFGINTSGSTNPLESAGTIYPADNGRSTSWQTFSWTGQATGSMITLFLDTYDGAAYWDTATPAPTPVTLNNSAFPSNADGWNVVVWHTGPNLDGTMVWQSTNGNPTGNMLSNGSGATNNTDSCTREGGEINKAVSTAGYNTLVQVVYDVRMETNQTGTTCIGTCPVLEGNCADKLAVYYSTAGTAGPWTLLEAVNALSITQNVWSTRTINCPAAANNKPNFAVRFRWQFNTASDGGRLDNVKVIATP